MKFKGYGKFLIVFFVLLGFPDESHSFANGPVHHHLQIELEPESRFARIEDTVYFKPSRDKCGPFEFQLHADLKLNRYKLPAGWGIQTTGYKSNKPQVIRIKRIRSDSTSCPETFYLALDYSGFLHDPTLDPEDLGESDGFFFSGESYFYPQQKGFSSLITFEMRVSLPKPWQAVSQGERTDHQYSGQGRIVVWDSARPSEEIYLIGNRFHVYQTVHNGISLYAFLLQEEEELASQYLQTAKRYIDYYSSLIGSYPYKKFALIENSRQTGYGMPSFTLMGSRIIRFPFILHTSFPHEILHNWWGNGVFPKLMEGNWSEGLTAYLADHLLLELKGKGSQYRFQEMMKFANYVNAKNDFPLNEFRYRDSMASQAIGYAKLLMIFHMLRNEIGDQNFLKGLKRFYGTYKYRYAGYEAIRKIFEEVSGKKLDGFFRQWIDRKGAPRITMEQSSYIYHEGRYDLSLTVAQDSPAFRVGVPVAIWTSGSEAARIHYIKLDTEKQDFIFQLPAKPVAIRLDPFNDVFRLPGTGEAPASLGQAYGARVSSAYLPETGDYIAGYRNFAQSVAKPENIVTRYDGSSFPEGSLWVFGKVHPLKRLFITRLKELEIEVNAKGIRLEEKFFPWKGHSFVFTLPRMDKKNGTMTWVVAGSEDSVSGLIRKLPHYGKYGYLIFQGSGPDNRSKGVWPSYPEGLQKTFQKEVPLPLPEQEPLVTFPPFP